jgi:hypothetical protein
VTFRFSTSTMILFFVSAILTLYSTKTFAAVGTGGVPSWLPSELKKQLDDIPPLAPGSPLGEVYSCDPYCEYLGSFTAAPGAGKISYKGELALTKEQEESLKIHLDKFAVAKQKQAEEKLAAQKAAADAKAAEAADAEAKANANAESQGQNLEGGLPIRLGIYLDALFSSTSVTTQSNTDQDSDIASHPQVGGGFTLDVDQVAHLFNGSLSLGGDFNYWMALSPKASEAIPSETWSSYEIRGLFSAIIHPKKSKFQYGLLLEARELNYSANPDLGITFSSKYLWGSVGVQVQYNTTRLRILKSVYSAVDDIAPYRGTAESSGLTDFQLSSCLPLAQFFGGIFSTCGVAELEKYSINGTGETLQPAYTQNPTYNYSSFKVGLELRYGDFQF